MSLSLLAMARFVDGVVWGAAFTVLGALLGVLLFLGLVLLLPRIVNRFTPHIDEEQEIIRGNRAVADYFGRIVGASIIGASIIVAAAIVAGIHNI